MKRGRKASTTPDVDAVDLDSAPRGASGRARAFDVRHFRFVWVGGLVWNLSRWGVAFLGTYLINDLTGSPRLVQLAGTVLYAPLLVGGIAGGLVSDRFDRLRTVRVQLAILVPLSVLMGLAVHYDRAEVWLIYCYMFLVGIGWVTDMTSRRALIFDLVGESRLDNAMALEALSLSSGMVLGALVGGYAVEAVGIGSAYFAVAGFLALGLLALSPVKSPPVARAAGTASPVKELVEGAQMLRTNAGLKSILGVTVIANLFVFSYFPIIPVIAEKLDATPFFVGLLAAGTGIGMMTGSSIVARHAPRRRGVVYLVGLAFALVLVVPFGLGTNYWFVFGAIVLSGIGSGFFGATQSSLVLATAPDELRGRALGLLSMAIGALPVGMYALGELAERTGPPTALVTFASLGMLALLLWTRAQPAVRGL